MCSFPSSAVRRSVQRCCGKPSMASSSPARMPPGPRLARRQVADAKRKGATLLAGGGSVKGKGNWFEPTVFVNVDHRMSLMKDESFGPIIGIQKVADDAQAIALMNDTEYGLTAGVYTRDE